MKCNLTLHCGAGIVERPEVFQVPVPPPTQSWHPVPHHYVLTTVERLLHRSGLSIVQEAHSLSHEGERYFGLIQVQHHNPSHEYTWVVGLRNSHDKTFPAGLVAGAQVFVCDNLSFNGEIKIARKHTRYIMRDLPRLAEEAVLNLLGNWTRMDDRISAYHNRRLLDKEVHDLVVRAVDSGICNVTHIPHVLNEWRNPRYPEFHERTVWSLFNGFTEVLKGNLVRLPPRTERLHHLLDAHIGMQP
jgi:hypothetical protein